MKKFSKAACTLYPLFFFLVPSFLRFKYDFREYQYHTIFFGGERCYPFSLAISIASKSGAFWHFLRPQVFEKKSPHPAQDSCRSHLRPADLQVRYLNSRRINAENEIIQHFFVWVFFFWLGWGGERWEWWWWVVFLLLFFVYLKNLKMFKS